MPLTNSGSGCSILVVCLKVRLSTWLFILCKDRPLLIPKGTASPLVLGPDWPCGCSNHRIQEKWHWALKGCHSPVPSHHALRKFELCCGSHVEGPGEQHHRVRATCRMAASANSQHQGSTHVIEAFLGPWVIPDGTLGSGHKIGKIINHCHFASQPQNIHVTI